ncbi:MAG: hypothetical protein M1269_12200 [Chloroflexi bacterium]|nr:hypothetical protein [Chloroflexota bacterium]
MDTAQTRKNFQEVFIAPEKKVYRGLCSACMNNSGCTFPRNSKRPVLNCDEFAEASLPRMKLTGAGVLEAVNSIVRSIQIEESNTFAGLCRTCRLNGTCEYPKPEGGVWRCEDFE